MALSPDGRRLVFVAISTEGIRRFWVRRLDAVDAQVVGGSDGAAFPFWSPDGRSIGFFTDDALKSVDEHGGSVRVLCDVAAPRGGSWGPNGIILFADTTKGLRRVPDT